MPFTPIHLLAAAPVKALLKRHFSVKLFFATQVAIDTEPGFGMLFDLDPLHGPFHTWAGSLVPAALAVLAWRQLAGLKIWSLKIDRLSWPVLLTTAWYGAWTHVALDGFMHSDVPVWAGHSWRTEDAMHTLLGCGVIAGAVIAAFTYVLPWVASVGARALERLYARLKG